LCDVLTKYRGHRDDKVVKSALYLAEHLCKFHRRAFSWSSLERIDELVHVHRSPELRELLGEIVGSWAHCYLQPILNGMYAFRFRSEHAAELRFASRASEEEMAAFNFTLDESQGLKAEYRRRLQEQRGDETATFEAHAALGELYDWDAEFEQARDHYRAAIRALDAGVSDQKLQTLAGMLDSSTGRKRTADRRAALPASDLRRHVDWGLLRLRAMLQIGMTFERSRDFQGALQEYRGARTLARAIWFAALDDYGRGSDDDSGSDASLDQYGQTVGARRLHELKHMHLIYQPVLACAWVAEKSPSGIDTGPSMFEAALADLRERLPFVRSPEIVPSQSAQDPAHSNFALAIADLHNNAGSMYLLKGHHRLRDGAELGYLRRARYHYAAAIHEVRRHCAHRFASAPRKWGPGTAQYPPPRAYDAWPQFILRRLTTALFGLASASLARVRLRQLLSNLNSLDAAAPTEKEQESFRRWIDGDTLSAAVEAVRWIGAWQEDRQPVQPAGPRAKSVPRSWNQVLVEFGAEDSANAQLRAYLTLTALGANVLERGGFVEEAAREHLQLAYTIENLLWDMRVLGEVEPSARKPEQGELDLGSEAPRHSMTRMLALGALDGGRAKQLLDRALAEMDEVVGRAVS
jgi:hypothetical protein